MDVCTPYVRVLPNHKQIHDRCHFYGFAVQMGVCALYVRVPPNHRMYHYRCHFNAFSHWMGVCASFVWVPPNNGCMVIPVDFLIKWVCGFRMCGYSPIIGCIIIVDISWLSASCGSRVDCLWMRWGCEFFLRVTKALPNVRGGWSIHINFQVLLDSKYSG